MTAPALPQLGQVRSALYALTDALDDPVTVPAVRARVLDHAAHLDEEQRQRLALLLFELADAFA